MGFRLFFRSLIVVLCAKKASRNGKRIDLVRNKFTKSRSRFVHDSHRERPDREIEAFFFGVPWWIVQRALRRSITAYYYFSGERLRRSVFPTYQNVTEESH